MIKKTPQIVISGQNKCINSILFSKNFLKQIFFDFLKIFENILCKFKKFRWWTENFTPFFRSNFATIVIPSRSDFEKKTNQWCKSYQYFLLYEYIFQIFLIIKIFSNNISTLSTKIKNITSRTSQFQKMTPLALRHIHVKREVFNFHLTPSPWYSPVLLP